MSTRLTGGTGLRECHGRYDILIGENHEENTVSDSRTIRTTALFALLVTAAAVCYAAAGALTGWEAASGWLIQAVIHLGELAAVVALALSGAAGSGLAARIGLGAAMMGQAVLVAAEVVEPGNPDLGDTLFGIGPVLTGLGLVVAGVVVLRHHRWAGWRRFTPVAIGVYTFLVLLPALITSGGPPAPVALGAIAGWDLLWCVLAAAVLAAVRPAAVVGGSRSR